MNWNDYFYYDETSPSCLRWAVARGKIKANVAAGGLEVQGYFQVKLNGRTYKVHRIILEMFEGDISNREVDHINRIKSDNKIVNLRAVERKINQRNRTINKTNEIGFKGIYKEGGNKARIRATLRNDEGKEITKSFSIKKHGEDLAIELARKWREEKIIKMNESGLGYKV